MAKTSIIIFSIITIALFPVLLDKKADGNLEYDFCLKQSYDYYKENFMSKDGRIIDPERSNITTSEGQSYMLLRSLVISDKKTFDLIYKWARENLQRQDKLFAWLWGKDDKSGKYKILDENSATDADVDIAFALILAYEKWGNSYYLEEAVPIVRSIWDNETKRIGNYLVLMPGVNQAKSEITEVNPSYFSPYAFRFFQKYDELHDWNCLIDSSYYYIMASSNEAETKLPPDWFFIKDGKVVLDSAPRSNFSYDAIRVFTRIYLDYVRTGEKRALLVLEKSKFFITKWKELNHYYVNWQADGELVNKDEFIGSIAVLIPVMGMYDPQFASEVYKNKAQNYFENKNYWEAKHDYYGKNLLWFGCYLYNKNSNEFKDMHNRRIK